MLRCRKGLCQFAKLLGGSCEEELAAWDAQLEAPEPKNSLEVSKQDHDLHLELL